MAVIGFNTWELRAPLNSINRCQNNHWVTTRQRAGGGGGMGAVSLLGGVVWRWRKPQEQGHRTYMRKSIRERTCQGVKYEQAYGWKDDF